MIRQFSYQKLLKSKGENVVEYAYNYFQSKRCLVKPEKKAEITYQSTEDK